MKYLQITPATSTEPGLCVQPTMEKPKECEYTAHGYSHAMIQYRLHLESLPKLPTTCTLPAGQWFEGRLQHQAYYEYNNKGWTNIEPGMYALTIQGSRRKVIVPVEQKPLSFIVGKLYPVGHFIQYKKLPYGKIEYVFCDSGRLDTYSRDQVESSAEASDVPVEQKDEGGHDPNCYSLKPTNTFAPNPCTCKLKLPEAKPIPVRPSLYAMYYGPLKEIAYKHGYNLCIHGSMNRDFDLVAFPWKDSANPKHFELADEMREFLGGQFNDGFGNRCEGGTIWYPVNIWRSTPFTAEKDQQYYLDLKIFPPKVAPQPAPEQTDESDLDKMTAEKDYWYNRCFQAENFIENSPCDTDITDAQVEAHRLWQESKKRP